MRRFCATLERVSGLITAFLVTMTTVSRIPPQLTKRKSRRRKTRRILLGMVVVPFFFQTTVSGDSLSERS